MRMGINSDGGGEGVPCVYICFHFIHMHKEDENVVQCNVSIPSNIAPALEVSSKFCAWVYTSCTARTNRKLV